MPSNSGRRSKELAPWLAPLQLLEIAALLD
jgi:hypothetical protein